MDDLISRQSVVYALERTKRIAKNNVNGAVLRTFEEVLDSLINITNLLPSVQHEITHEQAVDYLQSTGWMQEHDRQMMLDGVHRLTVQPEKRTDKRTETHACDSISRQAAIDALYHVDEYNGRSVEAIRKLPPIQPEIVRCKDCEHGVLDDGFPHQYFCVFKGDEWNNADYFCGHAKRREVTT